MAKRGRPPVKRVSKVDAMEMLLKKWCVEQAMKWPTYSGSYGVNVGQTLYSGGANHFEWDVIARADKILAWVKAE